MSARPSLQHSSDEQLVDAVRQEDHDAVISLFERHHEAMLSFCRHMLGRRDLAEDVVRTSFDDALRGLRRHDRPVQIRALLFAVARNRCRAAREAGAGADGRVDLHGLDPEVVRDADLQLLAAAVARLPLDQRAVLLLRELDVHTHQEIATIAGCPADKADALLTAAHIALADPAPTDDWACDHVRPLLAASGGAPPTREALRRHVTTCESCSEFRLAMIRQRRWLSIVLPVTPSGDLVPPPPPGLALRPTIVTADAEPRTPARLRARPAPRLGARRSSRRRSPRRATRRGPRGRRRRR